MLRTGDNAGAGEGEGGGTNQLPEDIFLPEPKIVQMHTRMKMFRPDEFTMEGIRRAGCDAHLHERIVGLMRNTKVRVCSVRCQLSYHAHVRAQDNVAPCSVRCQLSYHAHVRAQDNVMKLRLFSEYLQRILRQHISSLLNNDLRSNHALYTAKYLEQAKFDVCRDLRHLIRLVAPGLHSFVRVDKKRRRGDSQAYIVKEEAFAQVGGAVCAGVRRKHTISDACRAYSG